VSNSADVRSPPEGRPQAADSTGPSLVELAMGLAPAWRERAAEAKRLRRLPEVTRKDLVATGIVRGLQPARWDGGEVQPRESYSAIGEAARADGCAGWVAGIIGVHPWQTALYPLETGKKYGAKMPR
jgi:3-hydroxy-9,10-secoandrosta-1,3,5(10)-triene-9,17-dione monooxygenase